jgi:ABC-type glycerol-3-phosphate transport system substrate-binding protein
MTRRRLLAVGMTGIGTAALLAGCGAATPTPVPTEPAAKPAAAPTPAPKPAEKAAEPAKPTDPAKAAEKAAEKPPVAAKAPAAAPAGTTRVTLWHPWSRSIAGPYLDEIVGRYNQENAGKVRVEPEYITNASSELDNRIIAAIAANDPPNIGWSGNPRMAKTGKVLTLDPLISRDKFEIDQIPKSIVEVYQYGGKLHALPIELSVRAIWLNKPLFEKHKVE